MARMTLASWIWAGMALVVVVGRVVVVLLEVGVGWTHKKCSARCHVRRDVKLRYAVPLLFLPYSKTGTLPVENLYASWLLHRSSSSSCSSLFHWGFLPPA